ncbi:MAG: hypothetical protein CR972_03630 [Candidatus Moraniibacteriota bacterium]|nr:MAG: hypothetical protein CR972_03630 [Candidatus Moranbacteria bacterium]
MSEQVMVVDGQNSESVSTSTEVVVAEPMTVQDPSNIVPVCPSFVDAEQDAMVKKHVADLADAILQNPSDVSITSQMYSLGKPAMDANTQNIGLMDTQISVVTQSVTVESPVVQTITEIKSQLDLINPTVLAKTESKLPGKILGIIPMSVSRLPKAKEIMVMINERKDTISSTVHALQQHLWQERDETMKHAVQLSQLSNHLFETQEDLQMAVYQGQLIWEKLNEARKAETDPVRSQALTYLVNDLSMLVVDLQTVDQLNIQSRLGAENLINNARQIQTLVKRVTNILLPSVQNALAVKAAAAQQAQLAGFANQVMKSASETIAQTASDIRQATVATAKMNTEVMIDMDAIESACNDFEQLQRELLDVFETAEKNVRGISNQMSQANERMRKHADPLTKARQAKESAGV